jgi:hypothetical protein
MVPVYLNTPVDFAAAIQIGVTPESLVLDFKSMVRTQDPKAPKEFCRDVAQFANTDGGCLLIGVEETPDPITKLKTASGISPVVAPDMLTQWMEQQIRNWLVPATFSHAIVPIPTTQGIVLAVNVFPSQHTVYLWDGQSHVIEVPRRTNHGKDWMNPDELERHIMNGSRATRLRIEDVIASTRDRRVELVGGVFGSGSSARDFYELTPDGAVALGPVGHMAFEVRIPIGTATPCLQVPYEAVNAAWVSLEGRIIIMLNVRVVWTGRELTLLPYDA